MPNYNNHFVPFAFEADSKLAQVERSEHSRRVLESRVADGLLHKAPVFTDVVTFDPRESGCEDASGVGGGFPCQAHHVSMSNCLQSN